MQATGTMIGIEKGVSLISGDQCAYWDGSLKLGVTRYLFPDHEIEHYVHDADTVGRPEKGLKETMIKNGQKYVIATEGAGAGWTSGAIMVPTRESIMERGEKFTGLVAQNPDEILASLKFASVPELAEIFSCPMSGCNGGYVGDGYTEASIYMIQSWLKLLGADRISIGSAFKRFVRDREKYLDMAINWHPQMTKVYNQCAELSGMTKISESKGELPFFFVFNEDGKFIRRKAYRHKGSWHAYIRNQPRPISIEDVVAIIPKAMLLGVILRTEGYLVLPKSGSAYMANVSLLVEALDLRLYPMIKVELEWNGHKRPFIGWINESEGVHGLRSVIEKANIEVVA